MKHGDRGHYIGRPSPLGNPFASGEDMTREESIEKYKEYFYEHIEDEKISADLNKIREHLQMHGEITLVCWCVPFACHGFIIKEYLENEQST